MNKRVIITSVKEIQEGGWIKAEYSHCYIVSPPPSITKWLNENTEGDWAQLQLGLWPEMGLYFQYEEDAVLYRLTWL